MTQQEARRISYIANLSVTYVSGTICYLCVGSLIQVQAAQAVALSVLRAVCHAVNIGEQIPRSGQLPDVQLITVSASILSLPGVLERNIPFSGCVGISLIRGLYDHEQSVCCRRRSPRFATFL